MLSGLWCGLLEIISRAPNSAKYKYVDTKDIVCPRALSLSTYVNPFSAEETSMQIRSVPKGHQCLVTLGSVRWPKENIQWTVL